MLYLIPTSVPIYDIQTNKQAIKQSIKHLPYEHRGDFTVLMTLGKTHYKYNGSQLSSQETRTASALRRMTICPGLYRQFS